MSTHSLRKKLLRSRPQAKKADGAIRKIRKYGPWVAAICVGAYLPPKVLSQIWIKDVDGPWFQPGLPTSAWDTGITPNSPGAIADFTFNYTANRTISLVGPPPLSPTVGTVRFNDTSPSSILSIAGNDNFRLTLQDPSGQATIDVSKGNTLQVTSAVATSDVLAGSSGVHKVGAGVFSVVGAGSYLGKTIISQGVIVANTIAVGGIASSIGQSSKDAQNFVLDGGVLRYISASTTTVNTDRSITLAAGDPNNGRQAGGTIDSSSASGTGILVFGSGSAGGLVQGSTIVSTSDGDRRLTLRGTNTGANEIAATITDFGNPQGLSDGPHTSLEKLDVGLWRLSASLLPATAPQSEIGLAYSPVYNANFPETWLGTLAYGNTYTGDTIVQRGTLQLVFPVLPQKRFAADVAYIYPDNTHVGVLNPNSTIKLGSAPGSGLPGGGTLDLAAAAQVTALPPGGASNVNYNTTFARTTPQDQQPGGSGKVVPAYQGAIQDVRHLVLNSGASSITRSGGPAIVNIINNTNGDFIVHNVGGTLRLGTDGIVRLSSPSNRITDLNNLGNLLPVWTGVGTIFTGWMHRDDNWVTPVPVETILATTTLSPNFSTPYALNSFGAYAPANDGNGQSLLTSDANVLQNSQFTSVFSSSGTSFAGNQRFINSIKFDGVVGATVPNKQFRISDGDDPTLPDFLEPASVMAIKSGGLLMSSAQNAAGGITQIVGGRITSGSGDFSIDISDPINPRLINRNGGTTGQSEIFAIIRSGTTAPLYLSSGIVDYASQFGGYTISTGLTKSGTGTLILLDSTSTGLKGATTSNYQGDTYINEGTIMIRADRALGLTKERTSFFTDPDTNITYAPNADVNDGTFGTHGQTYLLGTSSVLDFQAVNYTLSERVNVNQGEIQATIGRSSFAGVINNLNEENKVVLRIGTYLEINGNPNPSADGSGTDNMALIGVGGYQKLGAGMLVVGGDVSIGVDALGIPSTSEFPGSGDLQIDAGNSVWNGKIEITNGSINVTAGQHSFNGLITLKGAGPDGILGNADDVANGHLTNANSVVAFTKAGQVFTVELQQSGAAAQTLFGNLNQVLADGPQVYAGPITVGAVVSSVVQPGGSLAINGSIDFGTSTTPNPIDLTKGTLSQVAVVNSSYIPTTRFYGPVIFGLAGTISLNHNTLFNDTLTLGQIGIAVNLVTNGVGHTTFNNGITVVNGNVTLTDSSFTLPYTQALGTLTLNGLDTFNKSVANGPALTITGGSFVETGTRRTGSGLYGVRTTFNGDLTIAPPAALPSILKLDFSGNNEVQGNINITGNALLTGVTLQRADVTFNNRQNFAGTLVVNGGQVTIASSNALGAGSVTPGTAGAAGGVTLQGEKTVLQFQRGVATATGEDITINPSATAYLSGVAVTAYGSGLSAPTVSITGGAVTNATANANLSGTSLLSVTITNVGTGYSQLPTISTNNGTGNTEAPVFGGVVIRGVDQHNVIGGSIILNNVSSGKVNLGVPLLSVGADDTLQIKGDIFGTPTVTVGNGTGTTAIYGNSTLNGRFMTTALLGGGTLNSAGGIIILSGQVKDTSSGSAAVNTAGAASNILNTEWVGSNDLNIQVEKPWMSNGLIQMAQGVMRYTNAASTSFFATGSGGVTTPNFALSVPNTAFGHASVGFNSVAGNGIQSAAFFLTQPGQTFNAPSFSVYLGNSDKLVNDGRSTGFAIIGGENTTGTVTYGNHTGSITLDSDGASLGGLRDLRLLANAGGTVDIQQAFLKTGTGQTSIDKVGDGTVWLSGSGTTNSTLDRIFVLGGTLELRNFGANGNVQRLTNVSSALLFLGGGTVRLNTTAAGGTATAATAAVTQNLTGSAGGYTLRNGLSSLQVQSGTTFASTLVVGGSQVTLTRNSGSAVRFALTGTLADIKLNATAASLIRGTTNPLFWSSYGTDLDQTGAQGATNFAYVDATTFSMKPYTMAVGQSGTASARLDNLTAITANTINIEEAANGFTGKLAIGYTTVNTVRFNVNAVAGAGTLDLNGQTVSLGNGTTDGAIMVASNVTGNTRSITNGTLIPLGGTAALPNDIMIQNWGGTGAVGAAPTLLIGAILGNGGAGNTFDTPVSIVGDGTTVLTGANTFRGSIYLSGGTMEIASAAPLGADATTASVLKNLFMDGGTLHATADILRDKLNVVAYGDRSTIQIDAGKTFTLAADPTRPPAALSVAGGINSEAPEVVNSNSVGYGSASTSAASGSANTFNGDLVFSGSGTFQQIRDNAANTIAGQMFITGNARLAFEGNNFGWLGNNLSWMDGTTIASGATLELRPTVNSVGLLTVGEWLHINGAGQPGAGGALVLKRPEAVVGGVFVNAAGALTDHALSWTGPVTMDGNTTIFVDDKPEIVAAGQVGQLTMDDNIFDGGTTFTLTKNGLGILRFNNARIQNLGTIMVSQGEVRFEGGILGTIGSEANKVASGLLHTGAALAPTSSFNNFTSGTNSIVVGTGATSLFATGARLAFVDVRGTHTADIALNNGFLFVQSADAPLQPTSFAGDFTLTGSAQSNAIEAIYTNRVNPIVMFGAFNGPGGFTKFGNNEIDFVNPNSKFSGELVVTRGGGSVTSPGVGLYDGAKFANVSAIRLTNDGTLFLDNRNSLNASTGAMGDDNQTDRINDNAAIHLGGASSLRVLGNSFAATSEAMGVLNVHLGSSSVIMDPSPIAGQNQNVALSFQNYNRDAGGVVNFRVLKAGTAFFTGGDEAGNPIDTGAASIVMRGDISSTLFKGGAGLDRLGGTDAQSTSIVVGAFAGVAARDYASLPANTSLALGLNNNDQPFAGRSMMTVESVDDGAGNITKYLRPLRDSEYLNAGPTGRMGIDPQTNLPIALPNLGLRVTDTYDFDASFTRGYEDPFNPGSFPAVANGTNKNVRLLGKFGPSTSAIAETAFATEAFYTFDQRDDSRLQDSLYRVLANIQFNSLTFAQQTTEVVDKGGNRIILEISPDKTLTIGSGMILHAGLGIIGAAAPNAAFNSTQSALIRGGTLNFGDVEGIIQNVAAGLNETTGLFTSNRLVASSPIANNNISPSDLTISSKITGTKGLTKSGPSTVNLSGDNEYSGTTTVAEGILRLENNNALGHSNLVVVAGTGELRMQRGITVGNPANPHAVQVKFNAVAQPAVFRAEAGNNLFYGDIIIDTLNAAGDRFVTGANPFDVSIVNGTGASFTIGGDIFGNNTAGGAIDPLNDVQRGRQARIVNFNNASPQGGVIQIRGAFKDLPTGSVTGLVQSDNEEQVLRSAFTGSSNSNFFVSSSWDAAGSILLRQGALHLTAGLPGQPVTDFFTKAASNAINPGNAQAHPIIGDQSGLAGDVLLSLTTAGQVFNSPTLQVINNTSNVNVTIGGENTSGTVKFFAPSLSSAAFTQFNDATLRVSSWDRNVRLFAAAGGTVEINGRITDTTATNNGSIAKVGQGTVIMTGMDGTTAGYVNGTSNNNDFDKGIFVGSGKLILNSNVATNSTATNIWGIATTPLTIGGGKLEIRGDTDSTAAATDTWNGTITFKAGSSEVALSPIPGGGNVTLILGTGAATTRAAGSTVNFTTPGSAGAIRYLSSTLNVVGQTVATPVGGTVMLAPWATFGSVPGTASDFAAITNADATRTLTAFTGYTVQSDPSQFISGNYAKEAATGFSTDPENALTSTINVKVVRFDAASIPSTLYVRQNVALGNGNATAATDEGAILVPTGTNAMKTIAPSPSGGDLQGFGNKEIFIFNYGTGGLNISAPIIGGSPIVISGPGTTTLGRNKQTGSVFLNDGVISIDKLNFEPLTFDAANTGSPIITLPVGTDITNIRTGSAVVSSTGASLGTVLSVNSDTNQITVTTFAPVGTTSITINPSATVPLAASMTGVTSGTSGIFAANTANLAVGAALSGTGVPAGTTITSLVVNPNSTITATFSNSLSGAQALTVVAPNGLGQAASGSTGLSINGSTLQYTGNTVLTDRSFVVGDGGATFEVTQPTTSLQVNTIVGAPAITGGATNPYATSFTKTGPGTLVVSQASAVGNSQSGLTDVRAGTLTFQNTLTPLGTSTNALDGTIVRNGATLRFQHGADLTTQEWLSFEDNSSFDYLPTNANRTLNLDGVINVAGATTWGFSGANGGTANIILNPNAGYLTGAGSITKGTVNNPVSTGANIVGGQLVLTESNPEFSGGFNIEGGRMIIKSVGNPTGTGAAGLPINLGTGLFNDLTSATSKGSPEARLIFQIRDLVDADGGTTLTGAFDSFQINVGIPQDIVVQRPADAVPNQPSSQIKQIGVIGTGLSLDQYNLNGALRLNDDLQFYVEDSFTRVNSGEEYVNFNINGPIITDTTNYTPTFTTKINITGRPAGAALGTYNNLYVVVNLNHANPDFVGNLRIGNELAVANTDTNQVLRLNNDQALNSTNDITVLNNVTLQVPGHHVSMGSLIDGRAVAAQAEFSGGKTSGFMVPGDISLNGGRSLAIIENGSATPAVLTINQTVDAEWKFLIRDGFTADGARTAPLALVKMGPATVEILNTNDFTGGLTVLGGAVMVRNSGGSGSATGGGKVDVIGATFGGDNTSPVAGDLTIRNADARPGILAPGHTTDTGITLGDSMFVSKLIFAPTGPEGYDRVEFDFRDRENGGNDRVFLTSLEVDGPVELVLRFVATDSVGHFLTPGDPVTLTGDSVRLFAGNGLIAPDIHFGPNGSFYYDGQPVRDGSDIHGYYLDENLDPTSQAYILRLSITGADVRLTAVPEPNVALTLATGVGALLGLQRFRRRKA